MEKPMKVISLEDFKNSESMITVWEDYPPRPIREVRKESRLFNRLLLKIEAGTFTGKDFEEAAGFLPHLTNLIMASVLRGELEQRVEVLETYNSQAASVI